MVRGGGRGAAGRLNVDVIGAFDAAVEVVAAAVGVGGRWRSG